MSPRRFLDEHDSADITEWMALNFLEHGQRTQDDGADAQLHKAFGKKGK